MKHWSQLTENSKHESMSLNHFSKMAMALYKHASLFGIIGREIVFYVSC